MIDFELIETSPDFGEHQCFFGVWIKQHFIII